MIARCRASSTYRLSASLDWRNFIGFRSRNSYATRSIGISTKLRPHLIFPLRSPMHLHSSLPTLSPQSSKIHVLFPVHHPKAPIADIAVFCNAIGFHVMWHPNPVFFLFLRFQNPAIQKGPERNFSSKEKWRKHIGIGNFPMVALFKPLVQRHVAK